jgi:hypothetical protein
MRVEGGELKFLTVKSVLLAQIPRKDWASLTATSKQRRKNAFEILVNLKEEK